MDRSYSFHPSGTPASAQDQETHAVWAQPLPFLGPNGRVGIALMIICGMPAGYRTHTVHSRQAQMGLLGTVLPTTALTPRDLHIVTTL